MLAIGRLLSGGTETGNVRAGKGLGDGQAELLLAAKDLVGNLLLPSLVLGKVEHGGQANGHAGHVSVLEASHHGAAHLLAGDQVVEVVKLLALDDVVEHVDAVEVLSRAEAHVQDAGLAHLVNDLLADGAAGGLAVEGLGLDDLLGEDADGMAQLAVRVLEVGALEVRGQPQRLGVGDGAEVAGLGRDDLGLLALDGADGEVGVAREHLVAVEVVEGRGGVLAGDLLEHALAAGVGVDELGQVVDGAVDDAPEGVFGGVVANLFAGEGLCWGSHCGRIKGEEEEVEERCRWKKKKTTTKRLRRLRSFRDTRERRRRKRSRNRIRARSLKRKPASIAFLRTTLL